MKQNWKYQKMGDTFVLQMGKTPPRKNEKYWGGNNTWISIGDMGNSKFISSSKEKISDLAIKDTGIKIVPKGTVIMSFKLSVGKVGIANSDLYSNEAIMAFIPKCETTIISDYLFYYLKGYKWENSNRAVKGITLNKELISKGIIAIPGIEEQRLIVEELDLIQSIIDKQKRQLLELDNLQQSIFHNMFGDPITNEKKWQTKKVIEVVKFQRGYDLPTSNRIQDGGYPIFGSNGMVGYHNEYMIEKGIVTGRSGTIGLVFCYDKPFWPLNTTLFSINTFGNNLIFLKYLISNFHLERFKAGASVPTLNRNEFHNKKIISIPLALQEEFAEKIEAIERQKELIKKSIADSEQLLNYTMDKYFG